MQKWILAFSLAALVCGCDADGDTNETDGAVQVSLTSCTLADLGYGTRGGVDVQSAAFDQGETVRLCVFKTGTSTLYSSGTYTTTNTTGSLKTTSAAYFPPSSAGNSDLVGVYPQTVDGTSTTFTVQYDQTSDPNYKLSDLMYSDRITNQAKTTSAFALKNFTHKMAKVILNVTLKTKDDFPDDNDALPAGTTLSSIQLDSVYRSIGLTPHTGALGNLTDLGQVNINVSGKTASVAFLIPPQTFNGSQPHLGYFALINTTQGTAKYNIRNVSQNIHNYTYTFESGQTYTFNLTISRSYIKPRYTVNDWGEGDNPLICYFNYTGSEQVFDVPETGKYQLELWGAQGGSTTIRNYTDGDGSQQTGPTTMHGGYGGYSVGTAELEKGTRLYISAGGEGQSNNNTRAISLTGGWNGGGSVTGNSAVNHICASGGGATHIATKSGLLSTLTSEADRATVLIVAGGGGGARDQENRNTGTYCHGGDGGGITAGLPYGGRTGSFNRPAANNGTGYAKGQGESITGTSAGGGGWYGGYYMAGGSGYLNPSLTNAASTAGANTGNGKVKIRKINE